MRTILLASAALVLAFQPTRADDDPVFSGPQVGEKVSSFKLTGVFDERKGKNLDAVKVADGKPLVLIFMHELTRPSAAVTRIVSKYCAERSKDGLTSAVVYLTDDMTAGAERLGRARKAIVPDDETLFGISPDGKEGPGAYGLNRNMTLTILVANKNKVTANFALVQPSVQSDVPRIVKAIVKQAGGKVPTLAQLGARRYMRRPRKGRVDDAKLRALISPVIDKTATPEEVDKAAKAVEKYAAEHAAYRQRIGEITRRIINAGKLENYGTARSQEFFKKWAKEFKAEAPAKHVVFVIGEREYKTKETLPPFAKKELTGKLGWKCTFRFADAEHRNQIRGLDVLDSADLLVLSVRRRAFPAEEFQHIKDYLNAGKPLVGVRTASHAFDTRGNAPKGHAEWRKFDPEVLGGNYHGHYGASQKPTIRRAAGAESHPILEGMEDIPFKAGGSLYKVSPLAERCTPLLVGSIAGQEPEPVAWTTTYRNGRVFYTSLGHPDDFETAAFRSLLVNGIRWAAESRVRKQRR